MDFHVKASDYTPNFVGASVLNRMSADIIEGFDHTFDFTGRNVFDKDLETLAEIIIEHGVKIVGLRDDSTSLLENHIRKLQEPDFDDLDEYLQMFTSKFSTDDLLIWDRELENNNKKLAPSEMILRIVKLERIDGFTVYFRKYKSALMEPIHIHNHGGIDSNDLYVVDNCHLSDFANQKVTFRHPKNDREQLMLELFQKA